MRKMLIFVWAILLINVTINSPPIIGIIHNDTLTKRIVSEITNSGNVNSKDTLSALNLSIKKTDHLIYIFSANIAAFILMTVIAIKYHPSPNGPPKEDGQWRASFRLESVRPSLWIDVMPPICFYSYFRMMPTITSIRDARLVKGASDGLMTVLPELITACELVLKINVFRFLVSTRGMRLAGSMIKPLSNQSLHGSGPCTFFLFAEIVSPAPWPQC